MKTKNKIFALAIALIMALTLAACNGGGGNDNTPSGGTGTPSPSPSQSADPTPTPTPDTTPDGGGDTPVPDNDPYHVSDADIPNNGTPPNAPTPYESHRGDKGYFYTTSDDYIVLTGSSFEENGITMQKHMVLNFEDGICTYYIVKNVFERSEDAQSKFIFYKEGGSDPPIGSWDSRSSTLIDNVIYEDLRNDTGARDIGKSKDYLLDLYINSSWEVHDSKP